VISCVKKIYIAKIELKNEGYVNHSQFNCKKMTEVESAKIETNGKVHKKGGRPWDPPTYVNRLTCFEANYPAIAKELKEKKFGGDFAEYRKYLKSPEHLATEERKLSDLKFEEDRANYKAKKEQYEKDHPEEAASYKADLDARRAISLARNKLRLMTYKDQDLNQFVDVVLGAVSSLYNTIANNRMSTKKEKREQKEKREKKRLVKKKQLNLVKQVSETFAEAEDEPNGKRHKRDRDEDDDDDEEDEEEETEHTE